MSKTIFTKGLFVFLSSCFFSYSIYAQCLGPTSAGFYTPTNGYTNGIGKVPTANGNYFINHVFSTFSSTSAGLLNGNNFNITTGLNTSLNTNNPGENPVGGISFPSGPKQLRVSTGTQNAKITFSFTSPLPIGTHLFLQDIDKGEGWTIVFKNSSGPVDPSGFIPLNISTKTANLPGTYSSTGTSLYFKSTGNGNSEPLIGVIINSSSVTSIEVTLTDAAPGSGDITGFYFSVPLDPSFTATASNNGPICAGSTLNLTGGTSSLASTVPTPVSYIWSGPNSYSNTTTSTTSNISSVTTAATGTYSLTVQDAFGCFTTPAVTTSVTVNQSPAVTTANTRSICSGSNTNISLTASIPSTFTWTIGTTTGGITGASAGSGATINQTLTNPSNSTAGTVQYLVTPTSTTNSCAGATYTITVTVNPIPIITTTTKTICSGSSTNLSSIASTTSSYTWTIGTITGGITGASAGSGSTIDQILTNPSNSAAGTVQYLVTPTSTVGSCAGATSTITVTVNPPAPVVTTANTKSICSGSGTNISLTASASSSFAWTIGTITGGIAGASAGSGSTINQTLTNPSNSTIGTVQYLVTPTSTTTSCAGATYTITVTVNPAPSVSLSSNSPVNYGNTINLSATISGGTSPYTTTWSGPNSFSSSLQNPGVSSVISANAGIYTLQLLDNNGCSTSATTYVGVKSAWIYIHDKNINEESSSNFTFTLTDNSNNTLKTFLTNDSAGNTVNVYDLGAGHDDGAGTLWVIAGAGTGNSNSNAVSGIVYYRPSGSTNWLSTSVTNATSIDGAGLNQFVYINSSGDAYYYNAGIATLIFNHSTSRNSQTFTASDITYGGGKIALRSTNGRVFLYTGNFSNDSWTDISGNTNIADRIDMSSDGTQIVYISSATVKTYTISTGTTATLPAFTTTSGAGAVTADNRDIAIDDNGTIYATGTTGNTTCCGNTNIVFSYPSGATSWTAEPEARGVVRLTGGPGGQSWGSVNIGAFPQTIYTRVTDNTGIHIWLDDERVKNSSSMYGNSFMMEVDANTYNVIETLPNSTWDLGRYNVYDPTGNSAGNVSTNTATVRPAFGEVVHVEFINEKLNIKVIDNSNCQTNILQSFDAGTGTRQFGNATFGTTLEGTAYHYYNQNTPQDGYYYIIKSTNDNSGNIWFHNPPISDHSSNGGYFLMVNASYAKDEFYRQRITNLTGQLTYRIQFWVANVSPPSPIKPKIRFGMQTLSGTIFGDSTTPEVAGDGLWHLYSVSFQVPAGVTTADLFLRNENIGGLGNDLAIDDISINPIPTPLVTNVISPATTILCVGSTYNISNTVSGGTWSTDNPSAITIDSATGNITVNSIGAASITYTYINNAFCLSTAQSSVGLRIPPSVTVSSSSNNVCRNGNITLHASPSLGTPPYSYIWTGTGGTITSPSDANPILTAPSTGGNYNYAVKVTDSAGCNTPLSTTTVAVHAPASSINLICAPNASPAYAQILESSGSGSSWLWAATSGSALFYSNSSFNNGTTSSTLQAPYINYASQYKVVLTDTYGCKDSSTVLYDNSSCTLLASSLLDFTATKSGQDVLLNWKTSSETNNKYFLIQRSQDQNTWTIIGQVTAAGNSNIIKNYSFTDGMPLTGMNYYRLKQVDADGKYSISYIRSVLLNNDWKLKVYPNPVTAGILQIKSNIKMAAVRITDITGKVLLNSSAAVLTDNERINVSGFAPGIYFIAVINNKNEVLHAPFIKK